LFTVSIILLKKQQSVKAPAEMQGQGCSSGPRNSCTVAILGTWAPPGSPYIVLPEPAWESSVFRRGGWRMRTIFGVKRSRRGTGVHVGTDDTNQHGIFLGLPIAE
jgi:hypothetical protein